MWVHPMETIDVVIQQNDKSTHKTTPNPIMIQRIKKKIIDSKHIPMTNSCNGKFVMEKMDTRNNSWK